MRPMFPTADRWKSSFSSFTRSIIYSYTAYLMLFFNTKALKSLENLHNWLDEAHYRRSANTVQNIFANSQGDTLCVHVPAYVVCAGAQVCVCVHIMYAHVHACMHARMCACSHIYVFACICVICVYACFYVCVNVCLCACVWNTSEQLNMWL